MSYGLKWVVAIDCVDVEELDPEDLRHVADLAVRGQDYLAKAITAFMGTYQSPGWPPSLSAELSVHTMPNTWGGEDE